MHAEDLWVYQKQPARRAPSSPATRTSRSITSSAITRSRSSAARSTGSTSTSASSRWVVEIWSPMREAGMSSYKYIDWFRDHPPEDDLKLLRWSDEKLGGLAHIAVEAVRPSAARQGRDRRLEPLPRVLQSAAAAARDASSRASRSGCCGTRSISPKLELVHAGAHAVGGGNYTITLVVQNTGWLPSYVSKRALDAQGRCAGSSPRSSCRAGAALVEGKLRERAWPARRAARTSTPASRSGPTTT